VSVTGRTIQMSAGSTMKYVEHQLQPRHNTRVSIVPQASLPPTTSMTVAINGVQSEAGVS